MNTALGRVISNNTPLEVTIRHMDNHQSFPTVRLAGKIELSMIRINIKNGVPSVFWPNVRILDAQLRTWLQLEILKAWKNTPVMLACNSLQFEAGFGRLGPS